MSDQAAADASVSLRPPLTIHLVRHGQTAWNAQGRMQGWTDIPLNDTGVGQALQAAQELTGRPVTTVISSDLRRARQTAHPIADQAQVPLAIDELLRERRYGVAEGFDDAELERRFTGQLRESWSDPDFAFEGGESRRDVFDRVQRFFTTLLAAQPAGEIVVVSHGGTLRVARGFLAGFAVEDLPQWNFANGEIVTVTVPQA